MFTTPVRLIARAILGGVVVLLAGNLVILGASWVLQWRAGEAPPVADVEGVDNLRAVDEQVWRGARPSPAGYEQLAASGVTTVVDLRSESNATESHNAAKDAGLDVVHLPVRDGQIPTRAEVDTFLDTVRHADGIVFLHCGAGVGRTGSMAAAYLVASGQATPTEALRRNLAIGPPSLEQIAYVQGLGVGDRPGPLVTGLSRVLDAPRRLASRLF